MNQILIVMCGLPFSGKSTIARQLNKELGLSVLSYDHDIYAVNKDEVPSGTTAAKEFDLIQTVARDVMANRLKNGESFIYDDLCLELTDREKVVTLAKASGVEVILIYLDTPKEVIEQRRQQNIALKGRDHIDDVKLQLDISLLQRPIPSENAVMVKPDTPISEIVRAIQVRQ